MKSIFFSLAIAAAAFQTADAQSAVRNKLAAAALLPLADGYSISHDVTTGKLRDNQNDTYHLTLSNSSQYMLIAAGDGDVSDLDLTIYDENWNVVDRDTKYDALPILSVNPRWRGQFHVKVTMAQCNIQPCEFGLLVLSKGEYGYRD